MDGMETLAIIAAGVVIFLLVLGVVIAGVVFTAKGIFKIFRQQILRGASYIAVGGCLLLVIIAIVIPSFIKARNTGAQNACINNLRMIDSGKEQAALMRRTYTFELQSVIPAKDHGAIGKFLFRHTQEKPIQLNGFGFTDDKGRHREDGNTFSVRFETFMREEDGQWMDVPVGYCGTGAKEYPIQPNQDYMFLIPLWPFLEKGTHGIVKLSGTDVELESEIFETSEIQKIAKGWSAKGGVEASDRLTP